MASVMKRNVPTPKLLPWIPPGKPNKKESFNKFVGKKNSRRLDLELGKLNEHGKPIFGDDQTEKEFLNSSRKSEEDRRRLKDKIKDIFDEEEEDMERERRRSRREKEERRSRSEEGRRSRSRERRRSRENRRSRSAEDRRRDRSRSRSRERKRSERDDKGFKVLNKYNHNKTRNSSTDTSGIGSLVEDIEDDRTRTSIEFIDNVMQRQETQFDPGYFERRGINAHVTYEHQPTFQSQPQPQPPHPDPQSFPPPNFRQPGFQYAGNEQPQSLPMHLRQGGGGGSKHPSMSDNSYPQSHSPYGFQSINLSNSMRSAPEAWIVFPKDGATRGGRQSVRSFTARPVNFAGIVLSLITAAMGS